MTHSITVVHVQYGFISLYHTVVLHVRRMDRKLQIFNNKKKQSLLLAHVTKRLRTYTNKPSVVSRRCQRCEAETESLWIASREVSLYSVMWGNQGKCAHMPSNMSWVHNRGLINVSIYSPAIMGLSSPGYCMLPHLHNHSFDTARSCVLAGHLGLCLLTSAKYRPLTLISVFPTVCTRFDL